MRPTVAILRDSPQGQIDSECPWRRCRCRIDAKDVSETVAGLCARRISINHDDAYGRAGPISRKIRERLPFHTVRGVSGWCANREVAGSDPTGLETDATPFECSTSLDIVDDKSGLLGTVSTFPLTRENRSLTAVFAVTFAHDFAKLAAQAPMFLAASELAYFTRLEHHRRRCSYLLGRYAAKLALRQALAEQDLKILEIGSGVFGQPLVLHASRATPGVTISHGADLAVAFAFPAGHPMGVDIEQIDSERLDPIRSVMSRRERAWADQADPATMCTLVWTAKEALSKTLLCGLMSPLEILNLSELQPTGARVWEGRFENFAQYKFLSWASRSYLMSVVLPKNSMYAGADFAFDAIIARALDQ